MTTMLNFDQVVALTQQTINTQFMLMTMNGTIDKNLNVTMPSNPKIGIEGTLKPPTISIRLDQGVNPQQVRFNINIDKGTANYFSPVGELEHEKVDGYTIAMTVDLTQLTVTSDYKGLKVGDSTKAQTNKFLDQDIYTVTAILLDLDNVNYGTAKIYNADGSENTSSTLTTLLSSIMKALIKDGNPYIISIHPKEKVSAQTGLDGFKPTGVMYNTHLYNNLNTPSNQSTYNMLIMNQGHDLPWTNVTLPKFTSNLIDKGDVSGKMYITKSQFESVYIEDMVLPILKEAMGGNTDFTKSGNKWTYSYKTNQDGDHDGHGPVVGSDSGILDIYGNHQTDYHCELNYNQSDSTANQVVLKGSGYFFLRTDYYERPFGIWAHDAWSSAKKSFTFSITLEAGADGKITINFSNSTSDAVKDSWENIAVKFADLFNGGLQKELDAANSSYATFEQGRFSSFTDNADNAFNVLEKMVILPGASTYFFKDITTNAESDIIFNLTIKN